MAQNMTAEQMTKVQAIKDSFQKLIDERYANIEGRAERYYNCEDDYSSGGICDKADYMAIDRYKRMRDLEIEVVLNGYATVVTRYSRLVTLDGKDTGARCVETRYGNSWVFGEGENTTWVSCAKKQDTYAKKGYRMEVVEHTWHFIPRGYYSRNGYILCDSAELAEEKIIPSTDYWYNDYEGFFESACK